ncbi:MAG: ATP-dependent zinc protease [Proteobacteria bacterium]|nr:ATP-dependent zinc protease [Pseudomonadota bacterium]NOG61113.1 ATP-dependent zinc protease [Pseudomonadota bacterium]
MEEKQTIGWKEWLALPELGIPAIKAKIDTGARTSSLHTYQLERFSKNGKDLVRFDIHPLQKRSDISVGCESEVIDVRIVKDSGGHEEERFFIKTPVQLNDKSWDIEISLTNRENMLFRMLLGRTGLTSGHLLVDSSIHYALSKDMSDLY